MDSVIRNDLDVRQSFVVAVIDVVVSYYFFFFTNLQISTSNFFVTYFWIPIDKSYSNHLSFSHLCCISSGSFCFLLWSTGD